MVQYSLEDAQKQLQTLIDEATHGKTVLIMTADNQAVQLVPVQEQSRARKAGSAKGLIRIADDFDKYNVKRLWE